jgi:hypothetical protein
LDLKGEILVFYKLAPCVIGDRNVDDFVKPSLGFFKCHKLISFLRSPRSDGQGKPKGQNKDLVNLRALLIEIAERNDEKEDAKFMWFYRLSVGLHQHT